MIQIGTGFLRALSANKQLGRTQKDHYTLLAQNAQDQVQALQAKQALQTAYLFRTSAEKNRQAYENARVQLASRQAKWAAHGMSAQGASVRTAVQQSTQQAQLAAADQQVRLQTQAAQTEKQTRTALQKLTQLLSSYRRAARKKGHMGSLGAAFTSLFK